jgi:TonB family protein
MQRLRQPSDHPWYRPHVLGQEKTMNPMVTRLSRVAPVAVLAVLLALPAVRAEAQEKVYELKDVTTQPRLAQPSYALRAITASYPSDLKSKGISGEVELTFVVSTTGKVEPGSVEVTDASVPALGEAAKGVVEKLEFSPAKVGNNAVRSKVILPIAYRP